MIKVGSQNSNNIILEYPSVSRHHCNVEFIGNGVYLLEDNNSKNGTFLNDRRISKARFTKQDQIKLGSHKLDMSSFMNELQEITNQSREDFTEEYQDIFKIFEDYQKEKDKILKKPVAPVLLRVGMGLFIIIVIIAFPSLIPNDGVRIGLIMSVGLISVLANFFSTRNDNKSEKLDLLKLKYEEQLQCPKCKANLLSQSFTYLKGKGRCINRNCDAYFNI